MNTDRTSTDEKNDLKGTVAAISSGAVVLVGSGVLWAATQPGNHWIYGIMGTYFGVIIIFAGVGLFKWSLKILPKSAPWS